MSLQIEFGQMVRAKRVEANQTQETIAEMVDITTRHMHSIEYGETEPGLRTVIALADFFDIDLNALKKFAVHDADGRYLKEYDARGKVHAE